MQSSMSLPIIPGALQHSEARKYYAMLFVSNVMANNVIISIPFLHTFTCLVAGRMNVCVVC